MTSNTLQFFLDYNPLYIYGESGIYLNNTLIGNATGGGGIGNSTNLTFNNNIGENSVFNGLVLTYNDLSRPTTSWTGVTITNIVNYQPKNFDLWIYMGNDAKLIGKLDYNGN